MLYFLSINYHSTELLRQLLQSIEQLPSLPLYKVIIVNNSPDDQSVYDLLEEFQSITILTATENLGFGGGCNLGLENIYKQDPTALVWLINPDTVLLPQAISYIQDCFKLRPNLSILGTRIRAADTGDLWFAQGRFNWWTGSLKHRLPNVNTSEYPVKVLPSRWVSGCSMIFNLQQFDSCPLFDLNFFLDYEDIEICERFHRQGHTVGVTQAVLVDHAVSAITHRNRRAKFRHATFSKLYFLYKHGAGLALGLNVMYMLVLGVKLMFGADRAVGIGRLLGWLDFLGWYLKALTRQLSSAPFRPRTAFTQPQ